MMKLIKTLQKQRWLILLGVTIITFFYPIFQAKYPVPADTLLGMYHPWRDQQWAGFERFPFKNFLITDPVRQSYVYKQLAINQFKSGSIPSWNPYILAGTPLAAGWQAGAFYPLNFIFWLLPFKAAWAVFILIQPLLAAVFMLLYLSSKRFRPVTCWLMALSWAFSGFMMVWMTWGNIGHTALWLPLILLAIDNQSWCLFIFGLVSSILAGHTQTALYLGIFSILYVINKLFAKKINSKSLIKFIISGLVVICLSLPQWLSSWRLSQFSAREIDLPNKGKIDWFLPWPHVIQLLAPDFFGNPATQNYWGVWNYGEFVSYIGIVGLLLAIYGLFFSREKGRHWFILAGLVSLIFSLDNPLSRLVLPLPLIGSFQPSRLIYIFDFCLLVLAAYGLEAVLQRKSIRSLLSATGCLLLALFLAFLLTFKPEVFQAFNLELNLTVARRNLILPAGLLLATTGVLLVYQLTKKQLVLLALILLAGFDLLRFTHKFTPFVKQELIFPQTKSLDFLQEQTTDYPWRVAGIDYLDNQKRILVPNFNMAYKLAVPDGYEPLYLKRYGEFVGLLEWDNQADLANLAFNRIIIPNNYDSRLFDLLGVRYILSLQDIDAPKFKIISQEGETRIYENTQAFPRAFLVYDYQVADSKQAVAGLLLDENIDLSRTVILEQDPGLTTAASGKNQVEIIDYRADQVRLELETETEALLVLTDSYYPTWQASIDGQTAEIFMADYVFRAVVVPSGRHQVVFQNHLL